MNDDEIYEWYKMELCDLLDKKRPTKKEYAKIDYILAWNDNYRNKGGSRK